MHIQVKINGYEILASGDITSVHNKKGEAVFLCKCFFLGYQWAMNGGKL